MLTKAATKRSLTRERPRWGEEAIRVVLFACAFLSVATTAGIILVLCRETFLFFREVPIWNFLFGTKWSPLITPESYGVLPLLFGSLMIVVISACVAFPIGWVIAIYMSEYASPRMRNIVKPILEVLAGVPTVVYGYFALTFVTPALGYIFPSIGVFNALSGGIVVGIMILPMVASLSDDAMRAVPMSIRRAGYALGATRFEVSTRIVSPAALSGILASLILAVSRAIGETMIVTLAAGNTPNFTANPLGSIQTMTAYIVQVSTGDVATGSTAYHTLFAVGALLFVITLCMNILSDHIVRRYRETYE